MAEAPQNINQEQTMVFRNLLVDLKGHLNIPSLFPSFKTFMKTYLSPVELGTEDFLDICEALERRGHISPKDIKILKDATQQLDVPAYEKILIAEKEIFRLQKDVLPVTVHMRDVNPPEQEQELKENVLKFTNQELKNIIEQTDSYTRLERLSVLNTELEKFTNNMARFGIYFHHARGNSLEFLFRCNSQGALKRLWALYTSGELLEMIKKGIFTTQILEVCCVRSLKLEVYISEEEYEYCLKNAAEMSDSKVLDVFNAPIDEESKTSSEASEKKYSVGPEQPKEHFIEKECTDQDEKDTDKKIAFK